MANPTDEQRINVTQEEHDEEHARKFLMGRRFYNPPGGRPAFAQDVWALVELMRAVRAECAVESHDLAQDLFELGYKHKDAKMIADDVVESLKKRGASKGAATKPCPECGGRPYHDDDCTTAPNCSCGPNRCCPTCRGEGSIPSAGAAGGTK